MRTMILALAVVLLAAPVWAVVYITATDEGGGVVAIEYNSVGESNLPRAFALDITVTEGNIVDCCDYAVGDDNFGYGIFPGTFGVLTVNQGTGLVETWDVNTYTPVSSHPSALGGLDTNGITIEMGSLYDTNAPSMAEGLLCTVRCDTPCLLSVTLNGLRGGVVLEDANEPVGDVDVTGATDVEVDLGGGCFPNTPAYAQQYAMWVALGEPNCWCAPPEGSGYQCDGDTDGLAQWGIYRVFTDDLAVLAANWKKLHGDPTLNACAVIDHKYQWGTYAVFTDDLAIMARNWKKMDSQLPGNCPRPD